MLSVRSADLKTLNRIYCIIRIIPVAAILIACSSKSGQEASSSENPPSKSFGTIVVDTVKGSVKGAFQAALTPLEDVNLKRQPIPDKLKEVAANPYSVPKVASCETVTTEITALDAILGPDVVNTQEPKGAIEHGSLKGSWESAKNISWKNHQQYEEQGSDFAQKAAADAVRNHVTIFPYRSWVRWISGADAHAKKVAEAYEVGKIRRAFLKGFSINLHCWAENDQKPADKPVVKTVSKTKEKIPLEKLEEISDNSEP